MQYNCPMCSYEMLLDPSNIIPVCVMCDTDIKLTDLSNEFLANVLQSFNHQKAIDDNLEKAYNEIPHTFIQAKMIHLTAKINDHEVKFLVDTGAQVSIIPLSVVTACNLEHLIDEKYSGELKGVGSDKIMGKIHYVEIQLPCGIYPCGFTICKNDDMVPILGIDMMQNLGITLDFVKRKIFFDAGKFEITFE